MNNDSQINNPVVGQLRNKGSGSEVWTGSQWAHYSDRSWEEANLAGFYYMNPPPPPDKLTIKDIESYLAIYAGSSNVIFDVYRQLLDTMRENERLKEENELFRKGFGLAQTIKNHNKPQS